jgi:hypothetical protein
MFQMLQKTAEMSASELKKGPNIRGLGVGTSVVGGRLYNLVLPEME